MYNPSTSPSTGQTSSSAESSLQTTSLQLGGNAPTTLNGDSSQFGPFSSFTQVQHERGIQTTQELVPFGKPIYQKSNPSNAPGSHQRLNTHDNASGVIASRYEIPWRRSRAPSKPRLTHRGRVPDSPYASNKEIGGKDGQQGGPTGCYDNDPSTATSTEYFSGLNNPSASHGGNTKVSGYSKNLSQTFENDGSRWSDISQETQATPITKEVKVKVAPQTVSLPCRECVTRCHRKDIHITLKAGWFELLGQLEATKRQGTKKSKEDWDLLTTVASRLDERLMNGSKSFAVQAFVALMRDEYRKHLEKCPQTCQHATTTIKLAESRGTIFETVQKTKLASEPLQDLFDRACDILRDEKNWKVGWPNRFQG